MKLDQIFNKCLKLLLSKRQDYTASHDNHENFKRSAELSSWFKDDTDKAYVILIGTKLARLASLLSSNTKNPNYESINDTFEDLINYCALWYERRSEEIYNFPSSQIEYRCDICGYANYNKVAFVEHSIAMHSAIHNVEQGTLKFPNGVLRVL